MSPPAPTSPLEGVGLAARLRGSFAQTPRALALVYRASRAGTAALFALTLATALLPIAVAYAGKEIVDAVVDRRTEAAVRWVLFELGLVAALAAAQRGLAFVRGQIGARLGVDINLLILEKALALDLEHFENPEIYDRLTRARREASSRPVALVTGLFGLLQSAITLVGYAGILVEWSALAALALLASAVPATIAEVRFSKAAFRLRNWRSPDARKVSYLEYVLANDAHAKEVKVFGLGGYLLERYRELSETFFREDRALAARRAGWAFGLSLLGTAVFYGCYAAMAFSAARGFITLGSLTLYLVALRQGQQAFQSMLGGFGGLYEDNLYLSNLFEFLAIPTRALSRAEASAAPARSAPDPRAEPAPGGGAAPERGLVLDKVGFRYPGSEKWALRDVSFGIPAGRSLAIVGHNGAGKSTLIKLLLRLYEPTEGRILLDGRDLGTYDEAEIRRRTSVVFQDYSRYQFALGENVGFGALEHATDGARLERASEKGGALEVARGLPEGLETQLGRWFKGGVELSGGQWQKIALSRAFMREEADILILDEPTSALDAEAEHTIFERFRELTKGRTSILISHRFPTVRMADRIVVLDGGRLVEEDTHDALVAKGGRYAQLFSLQARGYL